MRTIGILIWCALAAWARGQETPRQAEDPNARLTRIAEALLGKHGGNQFFYFPTHDVPATPADWGFRFEDVSFKSKDGTPLTGWYVPAAAKSGKAPKATVVFSHGNAGSMGHHLGFCLWLVKEGYNVLVYDYRGFGKSGGRVNRRGMIDDVRAAFDYINGRRDAPRNIVSMGHSLGGAQSLVALAEGPVRGLRAVITDAAFSSYQAMARRLGGEVGGNLVSDELSPRDSVAKLAPLPLLIVHGMDDEVVPFTQGKQLFDLAKQPKTFFPVKGGGHGDALLRDNMAHRKKLLVWLDARLSGK